LARLWSLTLTAWLIFTSPVADTGLDRDTFVSESCVSPVEIMLASLTQSLLNHISKKLCHALPGTGLPRGIFI